MSHLDAPRGRPPGSARHRAEVKPRYGRIAVLGSSVTVVLIAILGGTGALPSSADDKPPGDRSASSNEPTPSDQDSGTGQTSQDPAPPASGRSEAADEPADDGLVPVDPLDAGPIDVALPGDSGSGKRIVFSQSRQRVWLVTEEEKVRRTYLVSGSAYDNLDPGTFEVYSRDKTAVGIDDSGTMRFFVRFTKGDTGAAIGFHDIPIDGGLPVQSVAQLGTPLSHGCIRQTSEDAIALWKFAPIGTTVVVTA
jgi:hypothetical protein